MELSLSNLALRHIVKESQFLVNGFVNKSQSLETGWVKLKIHTKEFGDKNLIITPNAFFVSNVSVPAKSNPGGFSAFLKKHLMNQRIVSITQHSADRIVLFEFPTVMLVLELFAKGNLVLCNKEMKIIKALRKEEWKDRKLEQGELYKFPSSKGIDPIEENLSDFEKKIKESKKTFFGGALDALNASPLILERAFDALALDKKKDSCKTDTIEVKRLLEKMKEIYSSNPLTPFIFEGVLYTADIGKPKEKEFDTINSALNALLLSESGFSSKETKKDFVQKKTKADKTIKDIQIKKAQIEGFEVKEKELQEKGEKIYLHYQEIKELLEAVSKAQKKGIEEKEVMKKINSIRPILKRLDFKKKEAVLTVNK